MRVCVVSVCAATQLHGSKIVTWPGLRTDVDHIAGMQIKYTTFLLSHGMYHFLRLRQNTPGLGQKVVHPTHITTLNKLQKAS